MKFETWKNELFGILRKRGLSNREIFFAIKGKVSESQAKTETPKEAADRIFVIPSMSKSKPRNYPVTGYCQAD